MSITYSPFPLFPGQCFFRRSMTIALLVWVAVLQPVHSEAIASTDPMVVMGTVTDPDGHPAADAKILIFVKLLDFSEKYLTTSTDDEGKWQLELKDKFIYEIGIATLKNGYGPTSYRRWTNNYYAELSLVEGDRLVVNSQLSPSANRKIRVLDPEGNPVVGAIVKIELFATSDDRYFRFPEEILPLEEYRVNTDERGMTELRSLPVSGGIRCVVETPIGGIQKFYFKNTPSNEDLELELQLKPVAKVEIKLVDHDGVPVANTRLKINSRFERGSQEAVELPSGLIGTPGGTATFTTDPQGTASTMLMAAQASVDYLPQLDIDYEASAKLNLAVDSLNQMTIRLTRPRAISGLVVDQDQQPVPDCHLLVARRFMTTDAQGKYQGNIQYYPYHEVKVLEIPVGFVMPNSEMDTPRIGEVPDEIDEIKIEPIVLKPATLVAGTVSDPSGNLIPGANVIARWYQQTSEFGAIRSARVCTDEEGRFAFHHLDSNTVIQLTAMTETQGSYRPTKVRNDHLQEVNLMITPAGMLHLKGEIAGSDGGRMPAKITVMKKFQVADLSGGEISIDWNGSKTISVQADGTFRSPLPVPRVNKYTVEVVAEGYLPQTFTAPQASSDDTELDFGSAILQKLRSVSGQVVATDGTPQANAKVVSWSGVAESYDRDEGQHIETSTDAQGHFVLTGLHPQAAAIWVEHPDFPVTGIGLDASRENDLQIKLFAAEEPISGRQAASPRDVDSPERRKAAQTLFQHIFSEVDDLRRIPSLFPSLGKLDPQQAVIESKLQPSVAIRARAYLDAGDFELALAEIDEFPNPLARGTILLEIADRHPDHNEVLALLARVQLETQQVVETARKIDLACRLCQRLFRNDLSDAAEQILTEIGTDAELLDDNSFAKLNYAVQLSRFNLQQAIQIALQADKSGRNSTLHRIAWGLATSDPPAAAGVLRQMDSANIYSNAAAVQVAYQMASVDVDNALNLLDLIDPRYQIAETARGLGGIARAISEKDNPRARTLLDQAFAALPERSSGFNDDDTIGIGVELLSHAEVIAPDRLSEYFWQVVKKTRRLGNENERMAFRDDILIETQARLGLLCCLYSQDEQLIKTMMEPVFAHWEEKVGAEPAEYHKYTMELKLQFISMAATDPQRAVAWAIRFSKNLPAQLTPIRDILFETILEPLCSDRSSLIESMIQVGHGRYPYNSNLD